MTFDEAQLYCVAINNGSGCIFQPFNENETYILTAKHVVETENIDIISFERRDDTLVDSQIAFGQKIEGENYFPHPEKDVAILKIGRVAGLEKLVRKDDFSEDDSHYHLCGFPGSRRAFEKSDWYRTNPDVKILQSKANGMVEAQVPGNPPAEEVKGQSGGLICKINNGYLHLVGIQNRMTPGHDEQQGRIDFSIMTCFDEIIRQYPGKLSPLLPAFMKCFSFLKPSAFEIDGSNNDDDIANTRGFLQARTDAVISSEATPIKIRDYFNERLLIHQQSPSNLESRALWLTWLEFLTILNIYKYSIFNEDELTEIFNSIRLLYSDTKSDWSKELSNMIYSDYRKLKRNGLVIVSVEKPPSNNIHIIDKNIEVITRARANRDRSKLQIDQGIEFPFDHYKFVHIDFFKGKMIAQRFEEYKDLKNDDEILTKLKNEYDELFNS